MDKFNEVSKEIIGLILEWESKLLDLNNSEATKNQNSQNRTIKQITGHLVDSATNNTHRVIHLQVQKSPCNYPDYANLGNNDRLIAIQNYNDEEWCDLVQLWKFCNLHLAHVIRSLNIDCLQNEWINALNEKVTLEEMVMDYPKHLQAHLLEIQDLIQMS